MAVNPNITLDVFIIGGGISGAAIASECAQKGLKVAVCGKGDVGGASSSHSDQILPGAFHFLKNHNLPFFNKALKEKDILKFRAPHLCSEKEFIALTHTDTIETLKNKLWLWVFKHWLAKKDDDSCATLASEHLKPLSDEPNQAWVFKEQMVNDSRLVIENLLNVQKFGGLVLPRYACIGATRTSGHWRITVQHQDGRQQTLYSRSLINAAGPWVNQVQNDILNIETRCWVELKRKYFLVVPRFYSGQQAYIVEDENQQLTVTPYQQHFCLVSLTDVTTNDQCQNHTSEEESLQVLARLNKYFKTQLNAESILQSFATQQPLYTDDNQAQQNCVDDYALDLHCSDGHSPVVSVFGGSFATHRVMALEVLQLLSPYVTFPLGTDIHSIPPLPGGDFMDQTFEQFILNIATDYPWLPSHLLHHYARTYGARCTMILEGCNSLTDLGEELCPGLREKEAAFLCDHEWSTCGDDILWRRTQYGLQASNEDQSRLNQWVEHYLLCKKAEHRGTMSTQFKSAL